MEKLFHLKENGTNVRTEILAGLTTFMTMAYIIALNPNLLTGFGANGQELWNAVFMATCFASAVGMFSMAFLANTPFAMAPGMGLNSFFAVVVANIVAMTGMSYVASFQAALCIILVEGLVFIVLSVLNIRDKIVQAIPLGVRYGIAPAIGLMLMNIGLGSNVGVYAEGNGFTSPFFMMRDFFGALTPSVIRDSMGQAGYNQMVLTVVTAFIGLFAIIILSKRGVRAAQEGDVPGLCHLLGRGHRLPGRRPLRLSGHRKLGSSRGRHGGDDPVQVQLRRIHGVGLVHRPHPDPHLLHDRYVRHHRHPGGHRLPGRYGGRERQYAPDEAGPAV